MPNPLIVMCSKQPHVLSRKTPEAMARQAVMLPETVTPRNKESGETHQEHQVRAVAMVINRLAIMLDRSGAA